MNWPRTALLSVADKTGLVEFATALTLGGTRILASGGTALTLRDAGVALTAVEAWTQTPEMLGGRVKTLHPHLHGPILARRDVPEDLETLLQRGLEPIDLVAVTLYPFEQRAPGLAEAQAIEEIDIGGVALLRAAAKNFAHVIVAYQPSQYAGIIAALATDAATLDRRRGWAIAAFAHTARYDAAIAADLGRRAGEDSPSRIVVSLERVRGLRYGENPHQQAALYAEPGRTQAFDAAREGKELSYNNLLDVDAAVSLVSRFSEPACVIVKHNQPCGVATAATLAEACALALESDERSAFGGIVAFNRPLNEPSALTLAPIFLECVAAPGFEPGAEVVLAQKKNLRLLNVTLQQFVESDSVWTLREVGASWLAQRTAPGAPVAWRTVTQRAPAAAESRALEFAWTVVAAARSNAVVIASGQQLIGLGAGQTSRVDAVDVAIMKAQRAGHTLAGAVLASDAFFPFADNIDHAAAVGLRAIVQPGGSMRDPEVIAACDRHGIAMVLTGRREFKH